MWEDPPANHERVRALLDRADLSEGDLVLLPEMFATGFSFNIEATNDKQGATLAFLAEIAAEFRVWVQGGRTVAACHRCAASNVMSVFAPGSDGSKLVIEYSKIHPFQRERERFSPGNEVMTYRWDAAGLTVCPAICYDLRFPELFRRGLKQGAEVYALGACWPAVRAGHWRALLIARAIENQAFVLGCNRCGVDPGAPVAGGFAYAGGSIVVSPLGEVLGELGDQPGILSVPIDVGALRAWRERFGAWKDMKLL